MPKFFYIARDNTGKKETGAEEAVTQDELIARLQAKGLILIQVLPEAKGGAKLDITSGAKVKPKKRHSGVRSDDLVLFCRQLATLLAAGITILKSLDVICKQVSSSKLDTIIQNIKKNMEAGVSFHEALAKHPKVFSDLWINIVESGEASGNLAVVLARLASHLERDAAFKKKVISALIYPAILMLAGVGALLFLTLKIIPTFAELFKGFNMQLPFLTRVIMGISLFLRKYILLVIGVFIAASFMIKKYIATPDGRRRYEELTFKLPVVGDFFRVLTVERFSSGMATLLESGVPILYSLEITEHSVGNTLVSEIIRKIKEDVRDGKSVGVSLEKSGFFDPMVAQMVLIGEEIGELPAMFKRLNAFYEEYVETFLVRITAMFEPVILLFMAFVIGAMVIGMFLPIFQLTQMGGM